MKVSFLIPALNEESNIQNCIRAIRENSQLLTNEYEIVVGDHGSTDKTATFATLLGAKVVNQAGGTIASLRNHLVRAATGNLLVFVDADVCITPEWGQAIARTLADLEKNPSQITGSRCSPPLSDNFIIANWFALMSADTHSYLGTGHIIFTRTAFDKVGGFNEELRTGEDYDFCSRAKKNGFSININPALKVIHHDYPLTLTDFVRRERWHGSGDFQSLKTITTSRVALLTVFFIICHISILLSPLLSMRLTSALVILLFCLMALASFIKFNKLPSITRAKNILLIYCYFSGRALSLFSKIQSLFHNKTQTSQKSW